MKLKDFTKINLDNATPQTTSDFLNKIPPEIRNRIYELVFTSSHVEIGGDNHDRRSGKPKAPGILLACKQAYSEGIKLYWSKSTFSFGSAARPQPHIWLFNIERRRRELLSEVLLQAFPYYCAFDTTDEQWNLNCADLAESQMRMCKAEGVQPGVLQICLELKNQGGGKVWEWIWTSDPRATAASFNKKKNANEGQ